MIESAKQQQEENNSPQAISQELLKNIQSMNPTLLQNLMGQAGEGLMQLMSGLNAERPGPTGAVEDEDDDEEEDRDLEDEEDAEEH